VIFVTIGSLFPFDRLMRDIDELASDFPSERFFAQIGDGAYEPKNIEFARWLTRREFKDTVREAKLIIAHAGMGSVITAMEVGKPILLVPRILELGEHTTDHQMATARWLAGRPGVFVCMESAELGDAIRRALSAQDQAQTMPNTAPEAFVQRIRDFILAD